ncbi:LytTR family DNA-binding domain-containing protein [Caulobacter sp. RL271]|uniref:LytTR family transcriptional regulator DNA-binding domain-containing protein n=1 Tax=Caulobacter segnis TaxID=88688 RepID=A0ABY4ZUI0_9CAUL|nr:LytTR family DNA-binding domain-containing protein [Caulobacter segnis]USQ95586.1 LytTR family transcriptional regulator DNA-binding domain-containing protein [Caulobacter segnis]
MGGSVSQSSLRQSPASFRERLAGAVHASRTAVTSREAQRGFLVSAVAGVFLALIGAFGSGEGPIVVRLAYWVGLCLAGTVVGTIVSQLIGREGRADERPWLYGSLTVVGVTLPFTVVVWLVSELAFHGAPRLAALPFYLGPVFIVSAAMTGLNFLVQRRPPETHAAPAGAPAPRFLDRLPPKLRGAELYAVEAEDHYLRLHTSRGQDLILMRLSDAVAELEGIEGAQTHRSWWVAKDAVEVARRGDGRATLTLKGGVEAPVSRAYAKALREAGWF